MRWHVKDGIAIHVARNAKSYRTPFPRFEAVQYPERSSYGRFDFPSGHCEWRKLEERTEYMKLPNPNGMIGCTVPILVTFFQDGIINPQKKKMC